jgi:23S rRNA (cytosine1962-C5)-methyltransferase
MNLFTAENWKDYELLDCGDLEKLERFGNIVLRRPEPQALWQKQLSEQEWNRLADVKFIQKGSHAGEWKKNRPVNDKWQIVYKNEDLAINLV